MHVSDRHRQPHQLPRFSRHAGAETHSSSRFSKPRSARRPAATCSRGCVHVLTGAPLAEFLSVDSREAAHAADGRRHRVQRLSAEPARSVSLAALQVRRGSVRDDRHRAREQARAPAAVRAQLRVLRRAGRAVLLDRSPHGRRTSGPTSACSCRTSCCSHASTVCTRARRKPGRCGTRRVAEFLQLPAEHMLFCGMALGYMDESAPINTLRTERAQLEEFATLRGFDDPRILPGAAGSCGTVRTGSPAPPVRSRIEREHVREQARRRVRHVHARDVVVVHHVVDVAAHVPAVARRARARPAR